ncbi:oxysterol-binding protein-related protein 10-like isoform X2 [Trichomycterus rosablanca]|uniref:oxysterol-binding protein-related protein 10-like isoform X2 n=1 Tax=Trichomycterus rosablanca TaxID=2290929 RepID=UPI002F35E939
MFTKIQICSESESLYFARYFVLDEDLNQLQYFMNENGRGQKPRGTISLTGASVTVSDEAPHTFVISSSCGDVYKLRAMDGTEQQVWMSHIVSCTTNTSVGPLNNTDEDRTVQHQDAQGPSCRSSSLLPSSSSSSSSSPRPQRHAPHLPPPPHESPAPAARHSPSDSLLNLREVMCRVECEQKSLIHTINSLPQRGCVSCLDPDLLLIKATSSATLHCLTQCFSILQLHSHAHNTPDRAHSQHTPNTDAEQTAGSLV